MPPRFLMPTCLARLLPMLALLLLSHLAWGQLPSYSPPPVPMPGPLMDHPMLNASPNPYAREGAGSYQTVAGDWHRAANMRFDGSKLVVKDATTSRLSIDKLRRLEISQDTFLILSTLPGRAEAAQKPEVLEVAFSQHGMQLLALYYGSSPLYFLQRPGVSLQLLPTDKARFKTAMLAIVQDCPALATQVADGTLGRRDALKIVQAYDACR
jgi:hypothetical protein